MNINVSFEVFPPKTEQGLATLAETAARLGQVDPVYISVTYGAGGSNRNRSFDAIDAVLDAGACPIAGHLTCVGQPVWEIDDVVSRYGELGVDHVVALRGDPPQGIDAPYHAHPDGYQRTADLVTAIKRHGDFDVAVSAYPERHPQSPTDGHDLDVLAAKVDAGADRAMTQMFFDNECFLRYVDRVRARGIDIPVVPGIFPIHSFAAVSDFAARCGATMPRSVAEQFAHVDGDPSGAHELAADVAAAQITELADHGVEQVHLYTLNRADLALAVCDRIGATALTKA